MNYKKLQFKDYTLLVSYSTVIGFYKKGQLYMDDLSLNISATTSKHIGLMTGYSTKKSKEDAIKSGDIIIVHLNDDIKIKVPAQPTTCYIDLNVIESIDKLIHELKDLS